MRWKRGLRWLVWLLCLGCVVLLAASECFYQATLARVPGRPRPVKGVSLPPLYSRMRWTWLEGTTTQKVAPVWLGTFVREWASLVLLRQRHSEVPREGFRLADNVARQWSHRDKEGGPRLKVFERFAVDIWLTRSWGAEELLAFDAEHTSLGSGLVGMRAGAEVLLGRDWSQLDVAGIALLLAMNDAPGGSKDPWCFPDRTRKRRDRILSRLRDAEALTADEAEAALAAPLGLATRPADWPPCPAPLGPASSRSGGPEP
ncbi:transglycosylase domain-containing protein [Pyxidicoccus sp. 3LFB2]